MEQCEHPHLNSKCYGCQLFDVEFLVVVVNDIRDHQRCTSNHNSPKNNSTKKSETNVVVIIAIQRIFDRSAWNETYQLKQEATISNSDFEFSVVVVHDIRDHQRCISDHNSPKNNAITNLKRTLLRPLQYKACLTGAFKTRRRSDKGIACFGWMFSA